MSDPMRVGQLHANETPASLDVPGTFVRWSDLYAGTLSGESIGHRGVIVKLVKGESEAEASARLDAYLAEHHPYWPAV